MANSVGTAAVTVITGTLVYALGHFLVKMVVEPIHDLSQLRGEIAEDLIFYSDVIGNPGSKSIEKERIKQAEKTFREDASLVVAKMHMIPWYQLWSVFGLVPDCSNVEDANDGLIFLSNSLMNGDPTDTDQKREEIRDALNLRIE